MKLVRELKKHTGGSEETQELENVSERWLHELRIKKVIVEKIAVKRKIWSAPGIAGIPNFWWKRLSGTWQALV